MGGLSGFLVLISIIFAGAGLVLASVATLGVACIGIAACLGIWARLAQAQAVIDATHAARDAERVAARKAALAA